MEHFIVQQIEKIEKINNNIDAMIWSQNKINNFIVYQMEMFQREKIKNVKLRNKVKSFKDTIRQMGVTIYDKNRQIEQLKKDDFS